MMGSKLTARGRRWATYSTIALVPLAAAIGGTSYVTHVEKAANERADQAVIICQRKDKVVDVLRFLTSPERQAAAQGRTTGGLAENPALAASNLKIRGLLDEIAKLPCLIKPNR